MRYIHFTGGTSYCGCDIDELQAFPNNVTDEELDLIADDKAYDNGESYSHVTTGWGDDFESEDDRESYFDDCWCNWEELTKEEFEEQGGRV